MITIRLSSDNYYVVEFENKETLAYEKSEGSKHAIAQDIIKYLCEIENADQKQSNLPNNVIDDGFGNTWSIVCPTCRKPTMQIVRPGKVQCGDCG